MTDDLRKAAEMVAYEVPLHELLERVPEDARLVIEDGYGTRFIPVGRMCKEAAEALRQAIAKPEMKELTAHDRYQERQRIAEEQHIKRVALTQPETQGQEHMNVFELIEKNGLQLHGDIEYFAELVRADEREACAKVCDGISEHYEIRTDLNQAQKQVGQLAAEVCGVRIRERGEK